MTVISILPPNQESFENILELYLENPSKIFEELKSLGYAWMHSSDIIPQRGDRVLHRNSLFEVNERVFLSQTLILFLR